MIRCELNGPRSEGRRSAAPQDERNALGQQMRPSHIYIKPRFAAPMPRHAVARPAGIGQAAAAATLVCDPSVTARDDGRSESGYKARGAAVSGGQAPSRAMRRGWSVAAGMTTDRTG